MKKSFMLEELDCANCAAKMERDIAALPDVTRVTVSFMAQKLVLEAPDDRFDAVLAAAQECIRKVEPDCRIVIK